MRPSARGLVFLSIGLLLIGLISLMAWGLANKTPVTARSGITRVQQPASDFTLQLFSEGQISLSELRGQPVVLNFWASWCPPCREESVALERAWRAYRESGVWIVGVDIQDTDQEARTFLREFGVTYPSGPDPDGQITVAYGVIGLPTTFFVSREGTIERRWVGAISEERIVSWIDELVAGTPASGETEGENLESFFTLDSAP